jgi:hypothetical protein
MMRFERRLRKLEALLTDRNGIVPYTAGWWDYWMAMVDQLIAGEQLDELIPLAFVDALMAKAERDGQLSHEGA